MIKFRVEPEDGIVVDASLVVTDKGDLALVLTPNGGEPVLVLEIHRNGELFRRPMSSSEAESVGVVINSARLITGGIDK